MERSASELQKKRSFLRWLCLSALLALVEVNVTSWRSGAFRQYLRDFFWLTVYRDIFTVGVLYALAGGVGWGAGWCLFRMGGKKGAAFFVRNDLALGAGSLLAIYGFWAFRKFLLFRGLLNLFGFVVTMTLVVTVAFLLGAAFQKLPFQIKKKGAIFLLLVTGIVPWGVRIPWQSSRGETSSPNILILSVDTLRPDRLGCFGYSKAETPSIDRLAAQGLRFTRAYAPIPLTAPSFCSLMTGLYPKTHGCRENLTLMDPAVTTLAERLEQAGYRTAAFVSGYPLKQELCSLSKGFGLYQDRFSFFDGFKLFRFLERFHLVELQFERRADQVSVLAIPWMRHPENRPFFAWVHYFDPHFPYRSRLSEKNRTVPAMSPEWHWVGRGRGELPPGALQAMTVQYDEEIAFADEDISRLLAFLEQSGLRKKTLVLFVSDHGESFDHDYYFDHGDRLYESTIRIPVILSYPGKIPENALTEKVIQSIDLFPTLLSMVGLPPGDSEGESLFEGSSPEESRPVTAELSRRDNYPTLGELWSLREGAWKLIYSPEGRSPELYNLDEDSGESVNLASKESQRIKPMTERLIRWMETGRKPLTRATVEGLAREKLKSLGYLQ